MAFDYSNWPEQIPQQWDPLDIVCRVCDWRGRVHQAVAEPLNSLRCPACDGRWLSRVPRPQPSFQDFGDGI